MSVPILPVPELTPPHLGSRNLVPAGAAPSTVPAGTSPWIHDTCPECGWDGDAAVILDPDEGLMGWDCPACGYFIASPERVA